MSVSLADFAQTYRLSEYAQKQKESCQTLKLVFLQKKSPDGIYIDNFIGVFNEQGYYGRIEDGRGNYIEECHLIMPNQPATVLPANSWNASMFEEYGYKVMGNPDQYDSP